ncbi:Hypothetical_protein [Hexamita inflata]|uniref:Hypothetical_protein n=1 Tax=Hexamita inflata TaxID=28002 RepID=A0ABP1H7X6_9EUKA
MFNLLFSIFLFTSTLADEPHADIILVNQQEQNITLKTAQSIIVGVKVPPAVRAHGKNVAYSQFAFQALTSVCNRNYILFNSLDNNTNYAVYISSLLVYLSFAVDLSTQQNENQEYIYLNVTSTFDTQMRFVATAIHQFDSQTYSLTRAQPESTFFVHKQVPGVNKRVKFEIDSQATFILWVCSSPIILNIIWYDCLFFVPEGSIIDDDIDITYYNDQTDYIYYSIVQHNDSNSLIKADIVDVYVIDINSHQDIQIQANTPFHFQFADDIPKDAYFEVLNIDPGVEICFTDTFEYPQNIKCKQSLNQIGKFNITEMNFLVQSQGAGRLEFQVKVRGSEKKKNQWIIWVAVVVALVVIGIVVFVFLLMKHKKQTTTVLNDENEIILGEK